MPLDSPARSEITISVGLCLPIMAMESEWILPGDSLSQRDEHIIANAVRLLVDRGCTSFNLAGSMGDCQIRIAFGL
ncbi:hypothetical protein MPTK1_1g22330 [Marchantia polymorpha subsp. ruderalis]|uniref:Uncharacterized protein n=2 Tax=Marchantia polymorpha TaxID=3197 RepID=A0AAF6AT32_MARPO|nr:hypothetical protein MARPO_0001s0571 [Marchantia polymorpha]BBM99602.1 hypothetical protein Mp_1g22330 [Marchantia polymorpha subsp. ruderalis]|eukprot:PTQ50690.1 hypothetical protein MARPO_0001s0571 [Marchantia polymorpha]